MEKDTYDFLRELYYTPLNVYTKRADECYLPCAEIVNGIASLFFFSTTEKGITFIQSTFSEEEQKSLAIGLMPLGDREFIAGLLKSKNSRIVFDNRFSVSTEDFIQANIDRINGQDYAQHSSNFPILYICDKEIRKNILTELYTSKKYTIMSIGEEKNLTMQTWASPEKKDTFFFYSNFSSALDFINSQKINEDEKKKMIIAYIPMNSNGFISLIQHSFTDFQMFVDSMFLNCKEYLEVNDAVIPDFDIEDEQDDIVIAYSFKHNQSENCELIFNGE